MRTAHHSPKSTARLRAARWLVAGLLCTAPAFAQGRPGGGGPGGGRGGPMPGLGGGPPSGMDRGPGGRGSNSSSQASGRQIAPTGRWWDNDSFARQIGINAVQQKRMDGVFDSNRSTLLKLYKNLQSEEGRLNKAVHANVSNSEITQQIGRVADARGQLERAYDLMQVQIRKEMTPEQSDRLDASLNR